MDSDVFMMSDALLNLLPVRKTVDTFGIYCANSTVPLGKVNVHTVPCTGHESRTFNHHFHCFVLDHFSNNHVLCEAKLSATDITVFDSP